LDNITPLIAEIMSDVCNKYSSHCMLTNAVIYSMFKNAIISSELGIQT